jgi:membrane protease subunit HflK
MPWSNQSGGGGGGPWKPSGGGNNPGPWGQGSGGGGGGGGGNRNTPPDLEEMLRRSQDRLKQVMPGGGANGLVIGIVAIVAVVLWLVSGFYTVQPNETGLNMVFGRHTTKTSSGLNYNWPYPIGRVIKLQVTNQKGLDIGFRTRDSRRGSTAQVDVPEESLMLTGDENIADVKFRVIWQIDPVNPENYAFSIRNPDETVKAVAESVMREIVGRTEIQKILTAERKVIEPAALTATQKVLDDYNAGVKILQVQLLSVDPPEQVIAAFRDVTAAQQEAERARNEAETYRNRVVPEARGQGARILQEAEGYEQQTVEDAKGSAARFTQIYQEYVKAPQVTRERIYLETMERVFGSMNKVIMDQAGGPGVVPYLPLNELGRAPQPGVRR